jgi:lambda family phage portal protein
MAADQVILGFRTLRPYQLRGVTPLAPTILLAHQLRDYLEAEIATAQKAARWLAFVTSQDPEATMSAFGALATPMAESTAGEKYTMEMGHAVIDFLRTGESVQIANHNRPGDSFEPFVKFILRSFAAAVGVSYELVSGDYYDAKYTAARVSRNDMLKGVKVRRGRIIRQLCENVRRDFMDYAVMTGRLDIPAGDYFANLEHYHRCVWMEPGMEHLDPLKEGRAEQDAVAAKLRSPQEVLQARGRDPEQVLDEWTEWKQMLDERGLNDPIEQSALQTNPAAVGKLGGNNKVNQYGLSQ